jgi:DNA-binding response OmpR family regulator
LLRILLVDDIEDHLSTFSMILEEAGYSVDKCSGSAAALLEFKPNYYDLAVLDYRMPGLNGMGLYRRIREIDPTTSVLIVTAAYEQLIEEEGDQTQGRDNVRIIRKPVSNAELLTEINSTLGKK